jgi:hypothetical protein
VGHGSTPALLEFTGGVPCELQGDSELSICIALAAANTRKARSILWKVTFYKLCPKFSTVSAHSLLPLHLTHQLSINAEAKRKQGRSGCSAMAQGRGSAAWVLAVCLLLGAATHNVEWTFNADSWSQGKSFRAGDVLGERPCPMHTGN